MLQRISDAFDGEHPLDIAGQVVVLAIWIYSLLHIVTLFGAARGAL